MIRLVFMSAFAVLALIACSETDQSLTGSAKALDGKPWQGEKNVFVAPGWTPGNKESWEKQIRTRGQNQNEYVRID